MSHRVRWTLELHSSFVQAVDLLGGHERATPKSIHELMDVKDLSIAHVKSHLQKFRTYRQRLAGLRKHEVFISFRGGDTRSSLTSHLYASLQNAGIIVFKDDDSIQRGDHISTSLLQGIENSQISIVFSKHYADSRWCLQELDKIMKCHKTIGNVVLSVFYNVDPSEVRHQTGEFGNAFQNLLNTIPKKEHKQPSEEEVEEDELSFREYWELRWREALREAAGLAGFVVLNSRNESETLKDIVENVTRLLDKTDLFIASNPVGVESRVRDMIQLLFQQPNNVELLGMWGMGGVGKTTIAKAVYNEIGRNFEGRSDESPSHDVF